MMLQRRKTECDDTCKNEMKQEQVAAPQGDWMLLCRAASKVWIIEITRKTPKSFIIAMKHIFLERKQSSFYK